MMDGTPLYDIKPYAPFADSIPDAKRGFTEMQWKKGEDRFLEVEIPDECLAAFPENKTGTLRELLAVDPRPPYQDDPERVYGMTFSGYNIKFKVDGGTAVVTEIRKEQDRQTVASGNDGNNE